VRPKHGEALLAGLIIAVAAADAKLDAPLYPARSIISHVYSCWRGWLDTAETTLQSQFGGLRVDDAIERAISRCCRTRCCRRFDGLRPKQASERRDQVREALGRDLEAAARYAADRAFRQYDAG